MEKVPRQTHGFLDRLFRAFWTQFGPAYGYVEDRGWYVSDEHYEVSVVLITSDGRHVFSADIHWPYYWRRKPRSMGRTIVIRREPKKLERAMLMETEEPLAWELLPWGWAVANMLVCWRVELGRREVERLVGDVRGTVCQRREKIELFRELWSLDQCAKAVLAYPRLLYTRGVSRVVLAWLVGSSLA